MLTLIPRTQSQMARKQRIEHNTPQSPGAQYTNVREQTTVSHKVTKTWRKPTSLDETSDVTFTNMSQQMTHKNEHRLLWNTGPLRKVQAKKIANDPSPTMHPDSQGVCVCVYEKRCCSAARSDKECDCVRTTCRCGLSSSMCDVCVVWKFVVETKMRL